MSHHNFGLPFLSEDSDLWEFKTTPWGLAPLTRKRRRRVRKVTLAAAIRAAKAAGIAVSGATVTADGVSLSFGEERTAQSNGHAIETADELRKLI